MSYFDDLILNISTELVDIDASNVSAAREVFHRLLFILKASMDDKPILVTTTAPDREHVYSNQEMLDYLQYTQQEMIELTGEDIFDSRDYDMAHAIGEANISTPYVARVVKKDNTVKFVKLQGLSIKANGISWRFLIFLELDITLS
jgi:PAS domain-containing protein